MPVSQNNDYAKLWEMFVSQNNQEALSVIYKNHFDLLYNFGFKYTSDKEVIENSIQNIFVYFLKIRKKLGPVNNVSGYLMQSFRRQLFLELKKGKKNVLFETFPEEYFNYDNVRKENEEDEEKDHLYQIVTKIIENLNPKQKEIINLRFIYGLNYKEISSMLDISVDSCYKSVYRSVIAIRFEAEKIFLQKKE